MISLQTIQSLSQKMQSTEQNVIREYLQHLFLSNFYQQAHTFDILFKGDTALRIAFNNPRFSEDLDFSALIYDVKLIENSILNTLNFMNKLGIKSKIIVSKETTGGYFAEIEFTLNSANITILLQFSKRHKNDTNEIVTISNDFVPPYTISILNRNQLFEEKIQALLTRAKPRDFYDIYFLIRSNLISQTQKKLLLQVSDKLTNTKINFDHELKQFLPKSHWAMIKNFNHSLHTELSKFI